MKIKKLIATMLAFLLLMTVGLTACSTPTDGGDGNTPPAETNDVENQDGDADADTEDDSDADADTEDDADADADADANAEDTDGE